MTGMFTAEAPERAKPSFEIVLAGGFVEMLAAANAAPELIIATAAVAAAILRFNFIDPVSPWMVDWLANVRPPEGYLQFLLVVHN
jgi:hypothetical protein